MQITRSFHNFFSLRLGYSIIFFSAWIGKKENINLNNLIWFVERYISWRCLWYKRYCHRKWTLWNKFKSWMRLLLFHIALIIIIIILSCHQHGYPWPVSPLLPIVHLFWQVPRATSRILTELQYIGSSWLPCFCLAMWGGP